MDRKNLYSSSVVLILLIISAVLLGTSVYNQRQDKIMSKSKNNPIKIASLKLTDASSKNVIISQSKFSNSVTDPYNPNDVSTTSLQSNASSSNNTTQSLQNAATTSSINFPIN